METRQLSKGGPQVPVMCLGGNPLGSIMGRVSKDQAIATIHAALEVGITFIDTAEIYRDSEALIGEALRGRRDEVFLSTKLSGDHSGESIERAICNSLRALDTDYIDLYQLHNPWPEFPIEETMGRLLRHQNAGRIKYIGISNFSADQAEEALGYAPIHSVQYGYSLLYRDAEEFILPWCQDNDIGVLAYAALAKGLLSGQYRPGHEFPPDDQRREILNFHGNNFRRIYETTERLKGWAADHGRDLVHLAIAWTLAHPAVTSALVGAKTPDQVRHNVKALDWKLTAEELKEIDTVQDSLRLSTH